MPAITGIIFTACIKIGIICLFAPPNCALAGFHDKLLISFGNITRSKELERLFLTFLSAGGIHVKILNTKNE
jgi:hypothetical protein